MYVSNSFKKYDGYKALKILEVTSILKPSVHLSKIGHRE